MKLSIAETIGTLEVVVGSNKWSVGTDGMRVGSNLAA